MDIGRPISLGMPLNLLLVNPGVKVPTAEIFRARALRNAGFSKERTIPDRLDNLSDLITLLKMSGNDLEYDACAAEPVIVTALNQIAKTDHSLFQGMSGSGATCFGIFPTFKQAEAAAFDISQKFPDWWVRPVIAH